MATELVTFKMEHEFLEDVDETAKNAGFQNRTEFIRAALREKVDDVKLKKAMQEIAHLRGASKKKTTDKERERIREKVFEEFDKKFK
ncbi:ribbon-helix-helix domain-containing protein [Candidatus Woesearchaeota archaeon]|nr:ribbon-helix-helix domain-containing protein [Candidatus Woesearchaeota archaeon]